MLKNLIIFPLTDFRFARPESYPSLLPVWVYDPSHVKMFDNVFKYVTFTGPFLLFLAGLVVIASALKRRRPEYAAAGMTFSVGYLLHYVAAHIQINTHIITMSVYAAYSGLLFYSLFCSQFSAKRIISPKYLAFALAIGWITSLAANPLYRSWRMRQTATASLSLPKISGFRVKPAVAEHLQRLVEFVDRENPPNKRVFVGLRRHDVVIIGDVMIYFILNRRSATRYQELHPAIADTAAVQREIISDLEKTNDSLIVLKDIFSDEVLERAKINFMRRLPNVGATDLDDFIRERYVQVEKFGPYAVWRRADGAAGRRVTNSHSST